MLLHFCGCLKKSALFGGHPDFGCASIVVIVLCPKHVATFSEAVVTTNKNQ
jgi:hypothetical protein